MRTVSLRGFIAAVEARQRGTTAAVLLQLLAMANSGAFHDWAAELAPAVPVALQRALRVDLSAAKASPANGPGSLRWLLAAATILQSAKSPAAYSTAALGASAGLDVSDAARLAVQLAKRLDSELDRRLAARWPLAAAAGAAAEDPHAYEIGLALGNVLTGIGNMVKLPEVSAPDATGWQEPWLPPAAVRKAILRLLAAAAAACGGGACPRVSLFRFDAEESLSAG